MRHGKPHAGAFSNLFCRNWVELPIRTHLPHSGERGTDVRSRNHINALTADVMIVRGNLADLIDYKSGADDRDYRPQLAGYALALFSMRARLKTIRCHILYGRIRRTDCFTLTQADAAGIVLPILNSRRNPARNPSPCDYCTFCARRMTCTALTERVDALSTMNDWKEIGPALQEPSAHDDPQPV